MKDWPGSVCALHSCKQVAEPQLDHPNVDRVFAKMNASAGYKAEPGSFPGSGVGKDAEMPDGEMTNQRMLFTGKGHRAGPTDARCQFSHA